MAEGVGNVAKGIGNFFNFDQKALSLADKVRASHQKWYGEYYLPNDLYAAEKGYPVAEYARTHGGLDGKEGFWLKEGYVIVNFDIESVKGGDFKNPVLSYWKAPKANMWAIEGFNYLRKDSNNGQFRLSNGDVVFYYANRRASDDYSSGGTH